MCAKPSNSSTTKPQKQTLPVLSRKMTHLFWAWCLAVNAHLPSKQRNHTCRGAGKGFFSLPGPEDARKTHLYKIQSRSAVSSHLLCTWSPAAVPALLKPQDAPDPLRCHPRTSFHDRLGWPWITPLFMLPSSHEEPIKGKTTEGFSQTSQAWALRLCYETLFSMSLNLCHPSLGVSAIVLQRNSLLPAASNWLNATLEGHS